jgi:hypothetical protein
LSLVLCRNSCIPMKIDTATANTATAYTAITAPTAAQSTFHIAMGFRTGTYTKEDYTN